MAEIDLIPADYRASLGRRRAIRYGAIGLAVTNALIVAVAAWLARDVSERRALAARLQAENAITQQQQQQLQLIGDEQANYEQQLALLQGLRAGAAIEDVFSLIDRAIVADRIWFLDWEFRRAGIVANGDERTTETGYFIIVSAATESDASRKLEVETRMAIRGQATDHQALSSFVRALFEQPNVQDVDLQRTSSTSIGDRRAIEFNITIILHSAYRGA